MKTILLAAPLLALGLSACETYAGPIRYPEPAPYPQPYPEPYPAPDPGSHPLYRAIGTEPFWELTIGRDLIFTDRGNNVSVAEPTPPVRTGVAGEIYQGRRINVNIVHSRCSDGMSDRIYPDSVQVSVNGVPYRGCGGTTAAVYPADNGSPSPSQGVFDLARTNWRVAAINGEPTPMRDYYLNFMPDRVSGKFGCNTIGAGYSVNGNLLSAGAIMMTRMACPNGSFEAQGTAIMAQPMTMLEIGDHLTLSNRVGTIELVRAR